VLFYGPPGSGKKSLVLALLSTIFGPGAHKTKVEQKTWKIDATSTRKIDVDLMTQSSNYHIEINPSDAGYKDRYVVQEVIKEMARSRPIDAQGNAGYKILVLTECDKLSKEAQHGLRRTMEKYSSACRLILIADSVNRVLEAVRSRCLPVRVAAPRAEEIEKVLYDIAAKEKLTLPPQLCSKVAVFAKRDMRRAILALEACRVANYPFKETQSVQTTDWELYIAQIAAEILAEQSPKRLLQVRGRIYELLVNCIPPTLIFQTLCFYLSKRLDDEMKHEVIRWSAHFEHKLQLGSKAIMHIEAFIAQFMATYKRKLISAFA
jgi:replication factor C subunit 3/5